MRVASKTTFELVKNTLARSTEQLNQSNRLVASGKKILDLSDDPVGLPQVLQIESSLANIEQLERNIGLGKSWLTASENALQQTQNLLSDTKALCVRMATASVGETQRSVAAKEVANTLAEVVSLAGTQVNGRYIFAGSKDDTAPFDGTTYQGDDKVFAVKVGRDNDVEVGGAGEAIFAGTIQALRDLKTALEKNQVGGIQAAIDDLGQEFDLISENISDVGSKMKRMEIKEGILKDMEITGTERLSKLEDADIAEAITDLKAKELAYQAALASSAKIMSLSLIDYL